MTCTTKFGPYRIEVHVIQNDLAYTISPGDEGGAFSNGLRLEGRIDSGDVDRWYFDAQAGIVLI